MTAYRQQALAVANALAGMPKVVRGTFSDTCSGRRQNSSGEVSMVGFKRGSKEGFMG